MAGVNSLALLAFPAAGQSEAEKFPLLPPRKKKKKNPCTLKCRYWDPPTMKGGGFAEVPWSLGFTELRWTDPRHLHILGRGMSHLWEVLFIGVEQFHRTTKGTGNSILSHHSFSCRFTK